MRRVCSAVSGRFSIRKPLLYPFELRGHEPATACDCFGLRKPPLARSSVAWHRRGRGVGYRLSMRAERVAHGHGYGVGLVSSADSTVQETVAFSATVSASTHIGRSLPQSMDTKRPTVSIPIERFAMRSRADH